MKEMLKYGFILGLICLLASGVLSVVNAITEPKIKLQKETAENLALKEVMPEGVSFKPRLEGEKVIYYTALDSTGKINGFIVKAEGKGYSSVVEAMAGLSLNLEITNVKILSQNETPGLGNRIMKDSFLSQLKGKGVDTFNQVQAITGATISSRAVINSLNNKISELKVRLQKEIQNGR